MSHEAPTTQASQPELSSIWRNNWLGNDLRYTARNGDSYMANARDIEILRSKEDDAGADALAETLGKALKLDDKFTAIALVCGPPTDTFKKDFERVAHFCQLAKELFNLSMKDAQEQRSLYRLYERWHSRNALQRMLDEYQRSKAEKAGDT